jgi:radical SAM protein with 4Fe4S-binding SPASM domain
MGTLGLTLSGGEVFLHKDAADFLYYARKKDFSISILSNLTLLDKNLIKAIKDVNVNLIQVSLYSMDPEEHDYITKLKGSHKKTINNIERLIAEDIPVQISCPVMKVNKNSYKNVLKWAYSHNMKAYTDFIMMAKTNFDISNLDKRINLKETEELIKDIIDVDEDYRTVLDEVPPRTKDIDKFSKEPVCGVGINNICMVANGNLYPCSGWQGYIIGNIKDAPLKEIWNNSPAIKLLRTITQSSFPGCLKCEAVDYCAMCMVRNFNESNGDMFKINKHFCDVAFLTKRIVEGYKKNKYYANS